MESAKPSPTPAKLNSQLFELLKIVITLVLTGVIGGGITYWYQNRAQQKQKETKDLETARESVIAFLREFADILEHRKYLGFRCLHALRDKGPPDEVEELWKNYMESVAAWNLKWNLYRALILEEPKDIEIMYQSLAEDCYRFYSDVISRIQEGKVGKRSWTGSRR